MNFRHLTFSLLSLLSLLLISCGGGSSSTPTPPPPPENVAPTASAGDDLTVNEQTSVDLSGNGSDSDGTIASYKWTQTAGESITLSDSTSATPSFDSPITITELTLSFELEVTDDDGAKGTDTINVVVLPVNSLPIANAGDSQYTFERNDIELTGSGEDNDGTITSYAWTQTSGTTVNLEQSSAASLTFTAPAITTDETLTFELTVTDNEGGQATASVEVYLKAYKNIADISFADANFQSCVNDIASTEGWSDIAEVDDIDCNSQNISDISGIDNFTYLTNLSLYYNQIVDIAPLANLSSLVGLDLYSNSITDISLISGLTSLSELTLSYNNIADITPLVTLVTLEKLHLFNSSIVDITPLTTLINLMELSLSYNNISDITPLVTLTKLELLYLNNNYSIVDISSLTALNNLVQLTLSFNNIAVIPSFAENTSLELLYLTGNEITDITPLSAFPELKTLYINRNSVTDISTLSGLTKLEFLRVGDNSITNFSSLTDLTLLRELFINENSITDISFLSGLTKLESLDLEQNSITDLSVLSGLTQLRYIYLWINDYSSLSPLSGLNSLTSLSLGGYDSNNNLMLIAGLTNLEHLSLSNTSGEASDITPLAGMTKLKTLWLSYNEITDISILSEFSQLQKFFMSGGHSNGDIYSAPSVNDLSPLSGLTNLETLWIKDHIYSNIEPLESILSLTSLDIDSPNVVCSDVDNLASILINASITRPSHCVTGLKQKVKQNVASSIGRKKMKAMQLEERDNFDKEIQAKLIRMKMLASKHKHLD